MHEEGSYGPMPGGHWEAMFTWGVCICCAWGADTVTVFVIAGLVTSGVEEGNDDRDKDEEDEVRCWVTIVMVRRRDPRGLSPTVEPTYWSNVLNGKCDWLTGYNLSTGPQPGRPRADEPGAAKQVEQDRQVDDSEVSYKAQQVAKVKSNSPEGVKGGVFGRDGWHTLTGPCPLSGSYVTVLPLYNELHYYC